MAAETIAKVSSQATKPQDSRKTVHEAQGREVKKALKEAGLTGKPEQTESEKETFSEKLKKQMGVDASGLSTANQVVGKLNKQFDASLGHNANGFSNEEKVRLF